MKIHIYIKLLPVLLSMLLAFSVRGQIAGNALHFDGAGDHVILPHFSIPNSFTIEAWIKLDGTSEAATLLVWNRAYIMPISGSAINENAEITIFNGFLAYCELNDNGDFPCVTSNVSLNDGLWHHVAVVKSLDDVDNIRIYQDGTLITFGTVDEDITTDQLTLGANRFINTTRFMNGALDEVRIWVAARTEQQIQDNRFNTLMGDESDLVAYYKMDQGTANSANVTITTLTDNSINTRDGTLQSFALSGTTSNFIDSEALQLPVEDPIAFPGNAINFDGVDDYVSLEHVNRPDVMTIEAWIRMSTQDGASPATVLAWSNQGMQGNYATMTINNGSLRYEETDAIDGIFLTTNVTVDDNEAHHIAIVRNGSGANNITMYIDGNPEFTNTSARTISTNNLQIGARKQSDGSQVDFFTGDIDEVRIWNDVRTDAEIADGRFSVLTGAEENLVAYYRFDQGDAGNDNDGRFVLPDRSPNELDGRLRNFALTGTTSNWIESPVNPEPPVVGSVQFDTPYLLGGNGLQVTASVMDDIGVSVVKIFYRNATTRTFSEIDMTETDDGIYSGTIPDAAFDKVGMSFRVVAQDIGNKITVGADNIVTLDFSNSPENITSSVGFGKSETDYRMISIPLQSATFSNVFDEVDGTAGKDFQIFSLRNDSYQEGSANLNFQAGSGYWILVRDQTTINVDAGTTISVTDDDPFVISLSQGWNLIGNPFIGTLNMEAVIAFNVLNGNVTSDQLVSFFTYNGTYRSGVQNLSAFQGALVRTTASIPTFEIPVSAISGFAGGRVLENKESKKDESYVNNTTDWRLKLNLKSGEMEYPVGGIGMHPDAEESTDLFDLWAPPRFLNYLETEFEVPQADAPITQSIVSPQSDFVWDLKVNSSLKESTVVSWDRELLQEVDGYLFLEDLNTGRVVDMKTTGALEIGAAESTPLKVHLSQYLPEALENRLVILGDSYPNPFHTNTIIPFDIIGDADTYRAVLSVYNIQGQVVNTLLDTELAVGHYEYNWSGTDQTGAQLPTGLYFYKLHYGDRLSPVKTIVKQN